MCTLHPDRSSWKIAEFASGIHEAKRLLAILVEVKLLRASDFDKIRMKKCTCDINNSGNAAINRNAAPNLARTLNTRYRRRTRYCRQFYACLHVIQLHSATIEKTRDSVYLLDPASSIITSTKLSRNLLVNRSITKHNKMRQE